MSERKTTLQKNPRNTKLIRKDKDWDLMTKERISCTLSKELVARLRVYMKKHGDIRDRSHAIERMCWHFLMNENFILNKFEQTEIEMAKWKTKLNQLNRRKQITENNEIQS